MAPNLISPANSRSLLFSSLSSSSSPTHSFSSTPPSTENKLLSRHFQSSSACSPRALRVPDLLPIYLTDARAVEKYHPTTCPHGVITLSVAENQMLEDLLEPAINSFMPSFVSPQIYYQPTHGSQPLISTFSRFISRNLSKLDPSLSLDEDGIVVGAGCNAVLENLSIVLASPGDAVLIPAPYYAAFEFDLVARAGLVVHPVNMLPFCDKSTLKETMPAEKNLIDPQMYYPNRKALDCAYHEALANGTPPRILLLSHPHNPLGICYPPHVIKECIDWAREREVHLISDEIYAGSVHGEDDANFVSALTLASSTKNNSAMKGLGLGDYVHFVYAMSKDFALSGLRIGVSYSENERIRLPLKKLNDFCQISSHTQGMVEKMLSDEEWVNNFLSMTKQRVSDRCQRLQTVLDDCGIPYLKATAGLFLWLDMSQFLPPRVNYDDPNPEVERREDMEKRERELYLEMLHDHGLLFTPGMSMRNELPGYFRCVFTCASDDEFNVALDRLTNFVKMKRTL